MLGQLRTHQGRDRGHEGRTPCTPVEDSPVLPAGGAAAADTRDQTHSILRTLTALVSMRAATWLTATFSVLVVPRFLGAREFGLLAVALAFNDYALVVTLVGARRLIVREVARAPEATWKIVVHAAAARLGSWAVLAGVLVPGILLMPAVLAPREVLLVFLAGVGMQAVGTIAISGLQGNHHLGRAAAFTTAVQTLSQVGVVVVVLLGAGLLAIAGVMVTAATIGALGSLWLVWRFARQPLSWDGALTRRLMRGGVPFMLADLAQLVYGQVDVLMLAVMASATDLGNYALAWRLTAIPVFLPVALRGALLPTLSVTAQSDNAYFRRLLNTSLRLLLAITIPLSFGIAALAPEAIALVSGGGFSDAVPSMVVLSVAMPLVAVDTVLGGALIAADQERPWAMVGWASALLNPLMNLAAIPLAARTLGDAAVGAAATTLLTELFMTVWAWRLLRGSVSLRSTGVNTIRAVLAGFAMVAAVLLLKDRIGVVAVVPVGALVYLAGAAALRLVTPSDVRLGRSLLAGSGTPGAPEAAGTGGAAVETLGSILVGHDPALMPAPIVADDEAIERAGGT